MSSYQNQHFLLSVNGMSWAPSPTKNSKTTRRRETTKLHCKYRSRAGSFHRYRGPPSSRRKAYKNLRTVRFCVNYNITISYCSMILSTKVRTFASLPPGGRWRTEWDGRSTRKAKTFRSTSKQRTAEKLRSRTAQDDTSGTKQFCILHFSFFISKPHCRWPRPCPLHHLRWAEKWKMENNFVTSNGWFLIAFVWWEVALL